MPGDPPVDPALHNGKVYLVTGGTGFLGSHLVKLLVQAGAHCRILSRSKLPPPPTKSVSVFHGSVNDFKALKAAMEGVDCVFHLAGEVFHTRREDCQRRMQETNVDGTLMVIRAASVTKCKVVYASSSGVVACSPNASAVATDDSPYCTSTVANWPYYMSKITAEQEALKLAKERGVPLVVMRPSMIIGPGDVRFRSTSLILKFVDRKVPVVPPGGVSVVDVRDVAAAFAAAAGPAGVPGRTYLLAGYNGSTKEFFELLERVSGVRKPLITAPRWLLTCVASTLDRYNRIVVGEWEPSVDPVRAEMGAHYWAAACDRAKNDLGFQPRDVETSLADTVRWIHDNRDRYGQGRYNAAHSRFYIQSRL